MSNIEWTSKTWNPIVGCSKVSAGCQNCYAINQAYRNAAMGAKLDNPGRLAYYEGLTEKRGNRVEWTGKVAFVPEALEIPLRTKKPTTWFVNSMSDLFHESVTFEQLCEIFDVMGGTPQHTYQILTKRPQRMAEMVPLIYRELAACEGMELPEDIEPPSHIWLGCTVENQATADERIPLLLQTPAAVRFLSCEPLLEDLDLFLLDDCPHCDVFSQGCPDCYDTGKIPVNAEGIDWVIVGGESGPGARPCDIAWIRSIVEQCKAAGVPCFVKQLGNTPKLQVHDCHQPPANWADYGSTGKGNDPDEWPEDLRVRQMPSAGVTA